MCQKLLALISVICSFNAYSIECTAHHRHVDEDGQLVQSQTKLTTTLEIGDILNLECELNGQLYFLDFNKADDDGLLQIVDASDYTKGIVSRSSFNKRGVMSLTLVDNQTVHRLECTR
jgi:hypothetical protein